ncbi:hypothetical protein [Roseovarius sp. Pro17]|uniref:hypothetical protein n=1 Tax=Roseovarius sp. Pro17 TaxID=3108175 RepID=UPI002D76B876|nr:hypothetical protein [Roseovarius sp. Pro17]
MSMDEQYAVRPAAPGQGAISRVSWGAIIAGAVVAVAVMIFFATLGIGMGAAIVDPQFDQNPGAGMTIGTGIYLVITQLIALGAGGYVASRMAGIPRLISSLLHGASVWAVATIFLAWASVTGAGAVFGAAGALMSGTASTVATAADAIIPDDISLPDPSELVDNLSMDDLPDELQATLRENGITEANLRSEAKEAFRNVFSKSEQEAAIAEARSTLRDIVSSPGDISADLDAFADDMLGGPNAILSEEDLQQARAVMERRLGVTPQEAEQMVNEVQSQVEQSVNALRDGVQAAQTQAIEAAQATSDALASVALLLALASLLGLAAACGGAFAAKPDSLIGDRRDDHV